MAKITWIINGKKFPWPPRPFPGIVPIWELKSAFIKDFISRNRLSPAKQEIQINQKRIFPIPRWWKFGIPAPHLHLDEDIYMLTKEQWKDFSVSLVKDMNLMLKGAKVIDFSSVMQAAVEADLTTRIK